MKEKEIIKAQDRIITATRDLLGWYETEMERSQLDDCEVPLEVLGMEKDIDILRGKLNGLRKAVRK